MNVISDNVSFGGDAATAFRINFHLCTLKRVQTPISKKEILNPFSPSLSLPLPIAVTQPNAKLIFALWLQSIIATIIKHVDRRSSNVKLQHDSYLILSLNVFNKSCAIALCRATRTIPTGNCWYMLRLRWKCQLYGGPAKPWPKPSPLFPLLSLP